MNKDRIHKNRKENWETPPEIFQPLNDFYDFTIDLAADASNHKLPRWIGPGSSINTDLGDMTPRQVKDEICWINPPYGKYLSDFTFWVKCMTCVGTRVVALLPASIDTRWFWENVYPHAALYGRRGRIQFLPRGKSGNPGGSILAVSNLAAPPPHTGWHVL